MNIREVTERLDNGLYTKPNDISDTAVMTYEVSNSLCEIDITEWINNRNNY